uniref:cyclin-dependent kinase n=1 Tax=Leishmania guyanensis TaxID=5670 RepID=A0A1E1J479_LEIGU|nr:mitogen-activated protein kinase,putative,kinase, putative [Leishmania guyanensis]
MESYETLGILGEGTYGVVVKARSRTTGKLVAIKRFKQTEQDEHVRKTSTREVRMLQLLRHPNVIRLEDVFRREGKLYLVFEFIDHTILQLLESTTRGLSRRELRRYAYQLLRGIEFCHKHNVIHRDVKPENVLIDESGLLKLCDFGFARQMSAKGKYTDYVATRWYRAPELLVGDVAYGKPVDVWALGCMFAELSDGQPLFPGESDLDQLCLILQTCGPVPARMVFIFEHNPLYSGVSFPKTGIIYTLKERYHRESDDWLDFLSSCLHTDPAQRLTCTELMELPYFTRDGFRDRYEAELRAATGLPQLQSTPMTSTPSTQRRVPDHAAGVGDSLKADPVVSPSMPHSSEIISPKLQGQQPLASNNNLSDTCLSKAPLEAVLHDANTAKGKAAGAPKSTLLPPHTPASDQSMQLPMILNGNSERAIAASLTDYLHQEPTSSSVAASPPVGAAPTEVAEGLTNADLLAPSCEVVSALQASLITNTLAMRDRKKKRYSSVAATELHRRSGVDKNSETDCAVSTGDNRGGLAKHISCHSPRSTTLPSSGVHGGGGCYGLGRENETMTVSPPSMSHGVADSNMRVVLTSAPPGKDGDETTVPTHRASTPASADKLRTTATTILSSPSLAATHVAPLEACPQDLPALSRHLPHHLEQGRQAAVVEQLQSRTPSSVETLMLSFRVRTRNPLASLSLENEGLSHSKANSEAAELSAAKTHGGISNSGTYTTSHVASEVKKRKLSRHKRETRCVYDQLVASVKGSGSHCSVPGHAVDEDAYHTEIASVASPSRPEAPLLLSNVPGKQQQHLLGSEPGGTHVTEQHLHCVGAGLSAPDSTHNRSVDAHGPLQRKERRSKPLPGSTYALHNSDQRQRQQPHPRLDGSLQPDGGASQRATATLLALSALRNVSGPPPTKSTGDADKCSYIHHIRSHINNNGGEAVSFVVGGDGKGPNTSTTGRARRSLGVYALHGCSGNSDETEATRRVQKKNLFMAHGRTSNGAAGCISFPDKYTGPSCHAIGSLHGAPYNSFAKASKVEGEVGGAQQRQSLRKPPKKIAGNRGSGIVNTSSIHSLRHSLTTGRQMQHQQQLAKEEGGNGDGTARQFNAATAASPYTSN